MTREGAMAMVMAMAVQLTIARWMRGRRMRGKVVTTIRSYPHR